MKNSFPAPEELKEIIALVEASGQDPFDYDYWFSEREWQPLGGYCLKHQDRYVVALWAH